MPVVINIVNGNPYSIGLNGAVDDVFYLNGQQNNIYGLVMYLD